MSSTKTERICFGYQYKSKFEFQSKTEIHDLVNSFSDIFSDLPAKTNTNNVPVKVSSKEPVKLKPYPLSFSSEQVVLKEVNNMLLNDVIDPSDSPYSSPIVLVKM